MNPTWIFWKLSKCPYLRQGGEETSAVSGVDGGWDFDLIARQTFGMVLLGGPSQ